MRRVRQRGDRLALQRQSVSMGSGDLEAQLRLHIERQPVPCGLHLPLQAGEVFHVPLLSGPRPHDRKGGTDCAENGSIAAQGDVRNNTINTNGATLQASRRLGCGNSATRKSFAISPPRSQETFAMVDGRWSQ